MLDFNKHRHPVRPRRNRQRNIIWYNPPFSKSVKTNIGRTFLKLISRHFPRHHKYHSLFNKNNVKVSYSCMDNMQSIINKHNKKVTSIDTSIDTKPPRTGCSLGCAPGCDAGGREFEIPTGPRLRVFK